MPNRTKLGFWLLVLGVVMLSLAKGYEAVSKLQNKPVASANLTMWETAGTLLAAAGVLLVADKLVAKAI